jgi:hypothetical protein
VSRIFLSHSSTNNAQAVALRDRPVSNGWKEEIFLDLDPERGIAGVPLINPRNPRKRRHKMIPSTRTIFYIFVLAASNSASAQEKFSIEIPQKMDAVTVEAKQFGVTSNNDLTVYTEKDSNERTRSFNRDVKALGIIGKIHNCSLLIDVPAGTQNHSYGGFCSLTQGKKKRDVYICNDDMVGHFALYHASVTINSKAALIKFVVSNCIGG